MKAARQIELKGYVRALQPIIHLSGQRQGMGKTRISNIIEQKFICADGAEISVPRINGNAVRGILRDHVATAYCLANDIQFSSIEAFNLLFSGGMPLDKKNKKTEEEILNDLSAGKPKTKSKTGVEKLLFKDLDMEIADNARFRLRVFEELAVKHPFISLFGGSLGKATMIESRIGFSNLIPMTQETAPFIDRLVINQYLRETELMENTEEYSELPFPHYGSVTDEVFITKRDDAINPKNVERFNDDGITKLQKNLIKLASQPVQEEPDDKEDKEKTGKNGKAKEEKNKSLQNMQRFKAITTGTCMESLITLTDVTDDQISLFLSGLQRFTNRPYIGGSKTRGYGKIEFSYQVYENNESKGRVALIGNKRKGNYSFWEPFIDMGDSNATD